MILQKNLELWFKENLGHDFAWQGSLLWEEPLCKHTYYRIGGPAALLAIPKGKEEFKILLRACSALHIPYFILGAGSNLLVSDQGFEGVVIKTGRINLDLGPVSSSVVRAGGSVSLSTFLRRAGQEGWSGLELWAGVPGTVGGAIAMNAGTHLGETAQIILQVTLILANGQEQVLSLDELKFEYRKNLFIPTGAVVWSADFKVGMAEPQIVKQKIADTLTRRKETQPLEFPSCGSVFKNPKAAGMHAWQVVDQLGLRGHRIGNAQFSPKHSNFIVNLGDAKAIDVKALIERAKLEARDKFKIELEEEVKFLGQF